MRAYGIENHIVVQANLSFTVRQLKKAVLRTINSGANVNYLRLLYRSGAGGTEAELGRVFARVIDEANRDAVASDRLSFPEVYTDHVSMGSMSGQPLMGEVHSLDMLIMRAQYRPKKQK